MKFIKSTNGATAVEYGLIALLVSASIILALTNYGDEVENIYNKVETSVVEAIN